MRENVEKALQKIRPALQADGGDIELVDVVDGREGQIDRCLWWLPNVADDFKDGGGESPQAASSRGKER